jgi:hypothetical protein
MGMLTLAVMREEREAIVMRNRSNEDRTSFVEEAEGDSQTNEDENSHDEDDGNGNDNNVICTNANNISHASQQQQQDDDRPNFRKEESIRLERTRKMCHQALLYVGVFYLTWTPATANRFYNFAGHPTPFFILVLTAFLAPSQGFWNWLVYRHGPCVA